MLRLSLPLFRNRWSWKRWESLRLVSHIALFLDLMEMATYITSTGKCFDVSGLDSPQ